MTIEALVALDAGVATGLRALEIDDIAQRAGLQRERGRGEVKTARIRSPVRRHGAAETGDGVEDFRELVAGRRDASHASAPPNTNSGLLVIPSSARNLSSPAMPRAMTSGALS